jgi:SAM-dependent methyltransferase
MTFLCKYLRSGSRVLDAGCGAGILTLEAAKKSFYVYGIDISTKMIDLCEHGFAQSGIKSSKYQFKVGNVTDADLSPGSFDGIIALGLLEYQNDELKTLSSLYKALRPGGTLICSGPVKISISNFFGLGILLERLYFRIKKRKRISINRYNLTRFKKLLNSSGFTLIDYRRHGFAGFMGIYKIIGFRGELFLSNICNRISDFLPIDKFANDIIVVATKNNAKQDV